MEHVNESHISSNTENEINYNTSEKSDNPISDLSQIMKILLIFVELMILEMKILSGLS